MEKIKKNNKFINSYNYFIKDFLFFYFCMKKFYSVCNFADKSKKDLLLESIEDIKNSFIDKFKTSINENFTRAFTLVKNIEKNAEMNGQFDKENIVNVHIIEHLVDYMKKIGQSFTDLYDIFYIEDDEFFYSPKDPLITQLREVFANEIINNYFSNIFTKLDEVTDKLKNFTETNEKLLIQKFFYFYYLLYKMNDVFISFINSNINYLVDSDLYTKIKDKMYTYLSSFYSIFINRMTLKVLLLNKDDFKYYNEYIKTLTKDITLFFANENYNSNRAYEKPIMKFIIYIYSLSTILLLMMNCETDFESYDSLLQHLTKITGIFFILNSIDFILKLHETAKMLSKISTENDLNAIYNKDTSSKLKLFLFQLRKVSIGDMNIVKYCAEKKISLEQFAKICGLILIRYLKISSEELKDKVSQNQIDEIESYIINF